MGSVDHDTIISNKADTVVIGAGVIGLAVARALAFNGREVIVLEANAAIGLETSSRNSEVMHAGIYYPPGSLKASTCVRGQALLYEYCRKRGIPYRRCGKLIVATHQNQIATLENIRLNAVACGVSDLVQIDSATLKQIEPEIRAIATLSSPSTGIIDSHALMHALQADLEAAGGMVVFNSRVTCGETTSTGLRLQVDSGGDTTLQASMVINAAGLYACEVADNIEDVPAQAIPIQHYARGHYFAYTGQSPFSQLVYPLPQSGGLGVHATLDLSGQLRFGPDLEYCEGIDYDFDISRKDRFCSSIRHWYPGLNADNLQAGYVGIRSKLSGSDKSFTDFIISGPSDHGVAGLVNLFGIESPGLTACLALADDVCAKALAA